MFCREAGGCPAASHFLLLAQKKVTKEQGHPLPRPSGLQWPTATASALLAKAGGSATRPNKPHKTRLVAELKQCSPKAPASAVLLDASARDFVQESPSPIFTQNKTYFKAQTEWQLPYVLLSPRRHAEQRRRNGGFRRGLSERSEFRSRPFCRAAQGTPARGVVWGAFSFDYFPLGKQRKVIRPSGRDPTSPSPQTTLESKSETNNTFKEKPACRLWL